MVSHNLRLIALHFNECITNRDIDGLARLMTDDHAFIDREGNVQGPKTVMIGNWKKFFTMCPHYRNTFEQFIIKNNLVFMLGYAYWSDEHPHDPAIWRATIEGILVKEWRIFADSPENRRLFGFV